MRYSTSCISATAPALLYLPHPCGSHAVVHVMRDVILKTQPVELYKILKFEGLVPSGGVAKLAIDSGDVIVNGEVETRKRKKIVAGDVIEFNGEVIRLIVHSM